MEEPQRRWYMIPTYAGYETKVKKTLEHRIINLNMADRILQVEVPKMAQVAVRVGQRPPIKRKIFACYVLVKMILDRETWDLVRKTPGVTGYLGTAETPTPLPDEEIDARLKHAWSSPPPPGWPRPPNHRTGRIGATTGRGDLSTWRLPGSPRRANRHWYAISVDVGQEMIVKMILEENLARLDPEGTIFRLEIPTTHGEPISGFLLVQMPEDRRTFFIVSNATGVRRVDRLDL